MEQAVTTPDVVQRIEKLQSDYANCIDDERYIEWPEFFTERCLYRITTRNNDRKNQPFGLMFCDSRGMLRDRIASMRNANIFEPQTYRHVLGRASVTADGPQRWIARSSYIVVRTMHDGAQEIFSTGIYRDVIVDEGDTLRFAERIVVGDSSRTDALLVIPL